MALCQPTHHVLWVWWGSWFQSAKDLNDTPCRKPSEKGQEGGWCGLVETLSTLSKQAPISSSGKHAPAVALLSFCPGPRWRASWVIQRLRIRLPVQEMQVQALLREDCTCRGAAGPEHHNYRPCTLELTGCNERGHHSGRPVHCNWRRAPTRHS